MNALQYIKSHGVDSARRLAFDPLHPQMTHVTDDGRHWVNADHPHSHATESELKGMIVLADLKRLVESVDLVESLDGIDWAKGMLRINGDEDLKQTIADYESIYGGAE